MTQQLTSALRGGSRQWLLSGNSSAGLALGALGVVFGDIGTSPLYALKVAIEASGETGDLSRPVFGILSLITWSLLIVVGLKYVMLIMRADNRGEGGVFALAALIFRKNPSDRRLWWAVTCAATLGAALFFGDSLITPAISVLSAVEGLKLVAPDLVQFVLPITVVLITALFAIERFGTTRVAAFFGPVMLLWFMALGVLGAKEIAANPAVLASIDPRVGFSFLLDHGAVAIAILGATVLAITGGEALYADMGHFGRKAIRLAWLLVVLPSLLLNYYGQGALLLRDPTALENPFYRLAPSFFLLPLLVLAFLATIIASQAVISGAFSLANQAVQLGYMPRLRVRHTSAHEIGQVYVSKVNIALFVGVVGLVLAFGSSDRLASAYGVSVTGAMTIDTLLAGYFMIGMLKWNKWVFAPIFAALLAIDLIFFAANLSKFQEGGWLPIVVAVVAVAVMMIWITGRERLLAARWKNAIPLEPFLAALDAHPITRVPGTAVVMVPHDGIVPMALTHNLKHNKVLHERVILLRVEVVNTPHVDDVERLQIVHRAHNFYSGVVKYGFMEDPDLPRVLALVRVREFHLTLMETSFFIGKEKVVRKPSTSRLLGGFILMHRMMLGATDYFRIPPNHVIEIGGHVAI